MAKPEPASPCIRSCTLDPETDICVGCYRTLAEIVEWSSYSPDEKRRVLEQIAVRRREHRRHNAERGGAPRSKGN